ncbi:hypothetical protein [Microbacterium amylolyticum]|uniref:Uncharacterized protein n=1 Tax=Microbacterium amylolyticum TaxID=936337 RepID=A0ABS4ZIE4_9MICO|nr:hypothetical protein [Microbacterium amylolyticum]MBP2437053.1 hypothetical protein [Microbacterium amylolyticum]
MNETGDEPIDEEPPVEVDEDARAADLEEAIKGALGIESSFSELYAYDPSLWGGYINGVRTEGDLAFITLQVAADDPMRDDLGQRAAQALSTLLSADTIESVDIGWIIVEDASGVVIAQEQPAPFS